MKKEYQKPVSTPYSVSPFLMLAESSGTSIDPTPGEVDIEVEDAREDNTTGNNNGGNSIWDNVW